MQFRVCVCVLLVVIVTVTCVDAKRTYSSRRKSGNNRRGGTTSPKQKPPPLQPSSTHHNTDSNTGFLNSERAGSSHGTGSVNTHYGQTPFGNKPPEAPKQSVPQSNGPIGFERVNSEVQRKPATSNVPSAPAYPAGSPPYPGGAGAAYPGKPVASAPNGPPPAYPGYGSPGTGFDPPPAYPGRPVNAPPVYSANNPSFGQRNPAQPGVGGYPNQQGGFSPQGSYPGQSYPGQQNFGYPNSGGNVGHSYPGQQNFGYPNTGGNFGNYPNQGFGSHSSGGFGNTHPGGYGQSYSGFGGNQYGGSPFGHSNSFSGGGQFGSPGFGGNSLGGFGNSHYTPNNFGYSNNPGLFGSHSSYPGSSGNMFGQHKRSRFGGLPIPIPIPIPLGGFGGFGGHSRNHRVLDTFVKNKNISASDNATVFLLNNSTVTPCTTDQFIYDSLNVTVMSCTAGNCTAVKVFVTTNVSSEETVRSAVLTMCLEPNITYSSHADNVNPTVSDVHEYWMRVCREVVTANTTSNDTGRTAPNVTVKVTEVIINETVISESNSTESTVLNATAIPETTTNVPIPETTTNVPLNYTQNITATSLELNTTISNLTESTNTSCETFSCSWMEMCLPSVDIKNNCSTPICPPTMTSYRPCIRIKMCQSPTSPISTFATLNNTISRYDQFNNITTFNDVANLTLISFMPTTLPTNCSQNATDPACQFPPLNLPQTVCAPSNTSETASLVANNTNPCIQPGASGSYVTNTTLPDVTTAVPVSTMVPS